jgi:hypothetical protein
MLAGVAMVMSSVAVVTAKKPKEEEIYGSKDLQKALSLQQASR